MHYPFPIVPMPMITVSLSNNGALLSGSSLNISCDIILQSSINTPVTVDVVWTKITNQLEELVENNQDERLTVTDTIQNGNHFTSTLHFTTISMTVDPGRYHCNATITPLSSYSYVTGTHIVEGYVDITIDGK